VRFCSRRIGCNRLTILGNGLRELMPLLRVYTPLQMLSIISIVGRRKRPGNRKNDKRAKAGPL
jgi:hypothetical protein